MSLGNRFQSLDLEPIREESTSPLATESSPESLRQKPVGPSFSYELSVDDKERATFRSCGVCGTALSDYTEQCLVCSLGVHKWRWSEPGGIAHCPHCNMQLVWSSCPDCGNKWPTTSLAKECPNCRVEQRGAWKCSGCGGEYGNGYFKPPAGEMVFWANTVFAWATRMLRLDNGTLDWLESLARDLGPEGNQCVHELVLHKHWCEVRDYGSQGMQSIPWPGLFARVAPLRGEMLCYTNPAITNYRWLQFVPGAGMQVFALPCVSLLQYELPAGNEGVKIKFRYGKRDVEISYDGMLVRQVALPNEEHLREFIRMQAWDKWLSESERVKLLQVAE